MFGRRERRAGGDDDAAVDGVSEEATNRSCAAYAGKGSVGRGIGRLVSRPILSVELRAHSSARDFGWPGATAPAGSGLRPTRSRG
jgi:hypothetical protein